MTAARLRPSQFRLAALDADIAAGNALANPYATLRFSGAGDFDAMHAAERYLRQRGFSIGQLQGPAPRAIMFGAYDFIAKWRNLTPAERKSSHGQMTGDMRSGPVTVTIFDHAPEQAKRALDIVAADR